MAGYSGTPLPQKQGIKPGATIVTINAPTNYRRLLGTIPESVTFSDRLKPDSSFVHVFIKKRSELEKRLPLPSALWLRVTLPRLAVADLVSR